MSVTNYALKLKFLEIRMIVYLLESELELAGEKIREYMDSGMEVLTGKKCLLSGVEVATHGA